MTGFDYEGDADREETAALLRSLATGIAAGAVTLEHGEDPVTVEVPDELHLELEFEAEDDGTELEIELGWEAGVTARPAEAVEAGDREVSGDRGASGGRDAASDDARSLVEEVGEVGAASSPSETAESSTSSEPEGAEPGTESPSPADVVGAVPTESLGRFELFTDRADEYRWRLRHRNGNVIATSGEGYTTKRNVKKGLRSVAANAPGAPVVDESDVEEPDA